MSRKARGPTVPIETLREIGRDPDLVKMTAKRYGVSVGVVINARNFVRMEAAGHVYDVELRYWRYAEKRS